VSVRALLTQGPPHHRPRVTDNVSQTDQEVSARVFGIVIALLASGCTTARTPERPSSVSSSAVWAGGVDGGAWIDCDPAAKEPHLEYACVVYTDSGDVWASGSYIVAERRDGSLELSGGGLFPPRIHSYDFFNGEHIAVTDRRVLVPRGWIDYPFGDGHGKRVLNRTRLSWTPSWEE